MIKISDCWSTPKWLFDELSEKYGPFDIDLCATKENSKCELYCTDYLNDKFNSIGCEKESGSANFNHYITNRSIYAKIAWMNPPYSNPLPFIEKAWSDSKHCKIVLLVKVDPSTKWWSVFWRYNDAFKGIVKSGSKPGCTVHFLPKRVQFDPPPEMNAWKEGNKWYVKCEGCNGTGLIYPMKHDKCKSTGKKALAGPSFASAVVIFDRRGT